MFHRWAAPLLVLALCAMTPKIAAGQSGSTTPRGQGKRFGVYPNPFNPETSFDVPVRDDLCVDGSRQFVVTLKIHNILGQPIATPTLQSAGATSVTPVPPGAQGQPISNLRLGCGDYKAFWNGKIDGTTREAASGAYIARLYIDGKPAPDGNGAIRIFLSK